MDLACHHLETIQQESTTLESSQAVERRPGVQERHDMAEGSVREANLERHAEVFAQPRDTIAVQ